MDKLIGQLVFIEEHECSTVSEKKALKRAIKYLKLLGMIRDFVEDEDSDD